MIQYVSPELKQLYKSLEVDFDPLSLSQKLVNPIKFVEESKLLNQYVLPLQEMTVVRLIKQVSWCITRTWYFRPCMLSARITLVNEFSLSFTVC